MQTILAAIALVIVAMLALAVGSLWGQAPLRRSCGGEEGGACSRDCGSCERFKGSENA